MGSEPGHRRLGSVASWLIQGHVSQSVGRLGDARPSHSRKRQSNHYRNKRPPLARSPENRKHEKRCKDKNRKRPGEEESYNGPSLMIPAGIFLFPFIFHTMPLITPYSGCLGLLCVLITGGTGGSL